MKLIYIANVYLPGVWAHSIQVMKMCEAFAANGLEVELLTGLKRESDEKIFAYYNVRKKFKITKISYFDLSDRGAGKLNFLLRTLSYLLFAKLYLIGKGAGILYFRTHLAGLFFSNYYLEVHQLPEKIKYWHKLAFKKAKKLVVLTKYLKQELMAIGVSEDKIIIAADAVDLAEFETNLTPEQARRRLSLPEKEKIIAYCGNFTFHKWKGVDVLLASLKFLKGVTCLLVGGYPAEIDKLKELSGGAKLIITGQKAHNEVPLYLQAADILILPNKQGDKTSAYYTSPLKLFEYMASQKPVVASDLPSLREILSETNAVLVEPDNPKALAAGIKRVLEDGQLAGSLARQAYGDAQNYTWQKRAEKILT